MATATLNTDMVTYCLPVASGCQWRIAAACAETVPFVERLARVCMMHPDVSESDMPVLSCVVQTAESLEAFRAQNPTWLEFGRKHYFRFFVDETRTLCRFFLNIENYQNAQMKLLAIGNLATAMQLQLLLQGNCAPCHCAAVDLNGRGALICASGDTGKTTSARRIAEAGYRALADDYALIFDVGGKIMAQAMPTWSNLTSGNPAYQADCGQFIRIDGIFMLKHGAADYVERLAGYHAARSINAALQDLVCLRVLCDCPQDTARQIRTGLFDFGCHLQKVLPVYNLFATLHGCFWEKMIETMALNSAGKCS